MTSIHEALKKKDNNYSRLQTLFEKQTNSELLDPFAKVVSVYPNELPSVSIIIPSWNSEATLPVCLKAIETSSYNIKHKNKLQVVIVDDGSTDNTWKNIKKLDLQLNVTAVKTNHSSRAMACNTGASVASGQLLISCDADMLLSYLTIEHLASRHVLLPMSILVGFRSNTDDANLIQDIYNNGSHNSTYLLGDERLVYSTSGLPGSMAIESSHYKSLGEGRGMWMPDDESCKDPWLLCDQVFGALFCMSKQVFEKVGGYDERFFGWGCEDSFLSAKVIAQGHYVIPVYAASGLHIEHKPRSGDLKYKEYRRNRKLFYRLITEKNKMSKQKVFEIAEKRIIGTITKSSSRTSINTNSTIEYQCSETEKINTYIQTGCYVKALQLLESIDHIKQPSVTLMKAIALRSQKEHAKAIALLVNTDSEYGQDAFIKELLVNYAKLGDYENARRTLKRLAKDYPNSPYLPYWCNWLPNNHYKQGRKFLRQGYNETAAMCFDMTIIKNPEHTLAIKYRSKC